MGSAQQVLDGVADSTFFRGYLSSERAGWGALGWRGPSFRVRAQPPQTLVGNCPDVFDILQEARAAHKGSVRWALCNTHGEPHRDGLTFRRFRKSRFELPRRYDADARPARISWTLSFIVSARASMRGAQQLGDFDLEGCCEFLEALQGHVVDLAFDLAHECTVEARVLAELLLRLVLCSAKPAEVFGKERPGADFCRFGHFIAG